MRILFLFVAVALVAEQPKPALPKPLPAELRAAFWRATARANALRPMWEQAQKEEDATRKALEMACDGQLQLDPAGEVACFDRPKPEAKLEAPK